MIKLFLVVAAVISAVVFTALFLRRNKKIAAQVDIVTTKVGADIDKATGGKL